jgi:hypothetical protein
VDSPASKKSKRLDPAQKKELLRLAREVITAFEAGMLRDGEQRSSTWGAYGMTFFGGYTARYTKEFIEQRREFTALAAKMLKAKSAHEPTIRMMCETAGREFVRQIAGLDGIPPDALDTAATELVKTVLAEADREFTRIEPNFLIRHVAPEPIRIGRVTSMRTEQLADNPTLAKQTKVFVRASRPIQREIINDQIVLHMPESVWVVEVAATKENVTEEAKWLIDVAVSFMRLSATEWTGPWARLGSTEPSANYELDRALPRATLDGDTIIVPGWDFAGWYNLAERQAKELLSAPVQARANLIFDPPDKSLAQRVALGLGWMTRGRQTADRAERFLAFFTALEAVLTSNDRGAPVTQVISRYGSVIYTKHIKSRGGVFNDIKGLYSVRSEVVHRGKRDVLGLQVAQLEHFVEAIYWLVLSFCDLSMPQEEFEESLAIASHGVRWKHAPPLSDDPHEEAW